MAKKRVRKPKLVGEQHAIRCTFDEERKLAIFKASAGLGLQQADFARLACLLLLRQCQQGKVDEQTPDVVKFRKSGAI